MPAQHYEIVEQRFITSAQRFVNYLNKILHLIKLINLADSRGILQSYEWFTLVVYV